MKKATFVSKLTKIQWQEGRVGWVIPVGYWSVMSLVRHQPPINLPSHIQKMELTKEKIRELKEQSKYCALCGKDSLFDGCTMQIVSISESGQVIAPYDNETQGMSIMLPLCAYHMVLSQEGLLAITTQNQIIQSKLLTQLEPQSDEQLKKFILKLDRAKKEKFNIAYKQVAKTILNARKFQKEMDKEIEKHKNSHSENEN